MGLFGALALLAVPPSALSATTVVHHRVADAAAADRVEQLAPILYTAIDGHTETLIPWQGRYVSVLESSAG